ncbi:serine/threonine-protein kinase [Actinacidiphila glaucinigra]|uniref:serine/threonine-protein kinase n=1 Tax=Actinacidiphila glaucinigra TaxID=235986 RepID=UPI003867B482
MTASDSGRRLIDGRFELLERLGGGGMGLVWRARDTALHREVALKEVRPPDPDLADSDPEAAAKLRERVLREARALARVHHPNVATIHHIVDEADLPHPWLVMELVTGGSLQDRLARGPLTPPEAATVGRGVLAGLRAAHAVGVHHRDVKPANVLLRPDMTPVLTDFGIATLRDSTRLTTTGGLIGSPEYIAPERIRGKEGDPASDLWSLGMLLYVAVEGVHPLRRETSIATLVAVLDEPLPPPLRSGPLTPVLTALLVRDAAARPGADALDRMLADAERGAAPALLPPVLPAPVLPAPGPVDAAPPGFGPAPASYRPMAPEPYHPPQPATRPTPLPAAPRAGRAGRVLAAATAVAAVGVAGVLLWTLLPQLHGDGDAGAAGKGGTGTRKSTRSSGAPSTAAPKNLLSVAGGRSMADVVKSVSGGTKVVELTLYEDYASFKAPKKTDKTVFDSYSYRDGKLEDGIIKGTIDADDTVIDLKAVNWEALPALMSQADTECTVKHPKTGYAVVKPDIISNEPSLYYYRVDSYRTCFLEATLEGEVTNVIDES